MSQAKLEGVYTTNVEGQRPDQATASMEDYYIITGLDLNSEAKVSPNTTINLETGIAVEKHFKRPDLDNSENPFGRLGLDLRTELGRFAALHGGALFERTSQSASSTYTPSKNKKRDPKNQFDYGLGLDWNRKSLRFSADYSMTQERHIEEEFQSGDKNDEMYFYEIGWDPLQYAGVFYSWERKITEIIHTDDDQDVITEKLGIDGAVPLTLLRRPKVTYEFGVESKHGKDDDDDRKWVPMHTINAEDKYELSSTLELSWDVMWQNKVLEDDVVFTYGGDLKHQLSRTTEQSFRATREPVDTFGSTKNTDKTELVYSFLKNDLFIYNLNFNASISYSLNKPLDQPDVQDETIWTYTAGLIYTRALSRKLRRDIEYRFSRDDSSLEDEPLIEHAITMSYIYDF